MSILTKTKICSFVLGGVAIPLQGPSAGEPDLQLEWNWSELKAKVNAQVGTWLSRRSSLKGRAEACTSSPWFYTDWLYFLRLRHVGWRFNNPSPEQSGEVESRWSVAMSASNVGTTGVWVCLIWRTTGLLKDLHTWADLWRGTQCGDERGVGLFLAYRLRVDVSRWAKHCLPSDPA